MERTIRILGSWTATGIALLIVALGLYLASELVLGAISILAVNTFFVGLIQPYTFNTIFMSGLSLALLGTVALLGLTRVAFIERYRDGTSHAHRRVDRARSALLSAILMEGAVLASGLVLGYVYLSDRKIVLGIHIGAPIVAAIGLGLYLFWTAERIDPESAWPFGWIGLALGGLSATCWAGASLYLRMSEFTAFDAMSAIGTIWILGLAAFALGLLSVFAWLILYDRLFVKVKPVRTPSSAVSGA